MQEISVDDEHVRWHAAWKDRDVWCLCCKWVCHGLTDSIPTMQLSIRTCYLLPIHDMIFNYIFHFLNFFSLWYWSEQFHCIFYASLLCENSITEWPKGLFGSASIVKTRLWNSYPSKGAEVSRVARVVFPHSCLVPLPLCVVLVLPIMVCHHISKEAKQMALSMFLQGLSNAEVVKLWPGIRLDLRFLRVVSVLGFLLLPPATQICGKRVFGVMQWIDCERRHGGILQVDSVM